jgi:hypothetical protein
MEAICVPTGSGDTLDTRSHDFDWHYGSAYDLELRADEDANQQVERTVVEAAMAAEIGLHIRRHNLSCLN